MTEVWAKLLQGSGKSEANYAQDKAMVEYAKKNGLKACPKCKGWVEKVSGCQYIDCKCGAFWCFDCAALFDEETKKCTKCGYAHTFNLINTTAKDKKTCPNPKCKKQVMKS
jgi:hypothetical protein